MVFDLLVGKAQHAEILPTQPFVSRHILRPIFVLGAIRLHDQPMPEANEVSDVAPEDDLTSELQTRQPPVSQEFPEAALIEDGLMPHFLRTL